MLWPGPIAGERQHAAGPIAFMASICCIMLGVGTPQSSTNGSSSGGATTINTVGATLLVAFIRSVTGGSLTATITDSESNTWNYIQQYGPAGHSAQCCIAYVLNPTTSPTHGFVANNQDGSAEVYAFSGGSGSWSVDVQTGTNTTVSGSSVSTASITPAGAGEVIIAGFSSNGSQVTGTIDNGFTGGQDVGAGDALCQHMNGVPEVGGSGYLVDSGSGAIQADFTFSGSNSDWVWAIAAFKNP